MPIPAECPLCGHKGVLPDAFQGKQIKCPECCNEFLAGDPVPAKSSGSHPGTVKVKSGDSGQGNQKIKPTGGSAPGNQVVRPLAGSAQGVQKKPSDSAPGNQVIRPIAGSAPGVQKKPSDSAPGNQVIKPTAGSGQGTQKKSPAPARPAAKPKARGRGTFATIFTVIAWPFRVVAALRSSKTRRTLTRLAPLFWLLLLVALGIGGWFAWINIVASTPQSEEQTKATAKATTPKATTEKKPRTDEVFDASKGPAKLGPIHIRVVSVAVGPPVGKEITDRENRFLLKIQIENKGTARVDYQGWSFPDASGNLAEPVLTDSSEIKYKRVTFGPGVFADGQVIAETIHPDKWVNDVLVFEAPPDKVAFVKIELPAANLGAEGKVQIRIPRGMWGAIPPKVVDVPKEPVEPEPPEVKMYVEKLKSKQLAERRDAVAKLAELGPKAASAAPSLALVMRKDTSETVRLAAAEAIGKIGPKAKAVIPQLIEALEKDELNLVKAAAAEALGLMGAEAKAALPALQQALTSKEDKVPAAAKEAIQRIDPQAIFK
jgi:hypothetical protein